MITLQLIIYNVITSMLHHHVPYMKDLPSKAHGIKPEPANKGKISMHSSSQFWLFI